MTNPKTVQHPCPECDEPTFNNLCARCQRAHNEVHVQRHRQRLLVMFPKQPVPRKTNVAGLSSTDEAR